MRLVQLLAGLLAVLPLAVPVEAAPVEPAGMEVLYSTPPWAVYRNPDGPVCEARVLTADRLFELAAVKEGAVLKVAGKDWHFAQHAAMVHVVAGEGSGFGLTALYKDFAVQAPSKTKALYLMMGMLGSNVETITIKDDKLALLASFQVSGMTQALEVWKACADKL